MPKVSMTFIINHKSGLKYLWLNTTDMIDNKITTLKSLIHELECGTGLDGYIGLMNKLRLTREEVEAYCTWNDKNYTRNLLEQTSQYELILMCWEPGQASLIHSFSNQEGWMFVVDGELTVNHYFESVGKKKMELYKEVKIPASQYLYVNDYLGFHSVSNSNQGRTISLHLHAGPVDKWKVYDPETNAFFVGKTRIDHEFKLK